LTFDENFIAYLPYSGYSCLKVTIVDDELYELTGPSGESASQNTLNDSPSYSGN
jgi:hypothetical protein